MDYLTIKEPSNGEIDIRKSQFIVHCFPVQDENEALEQIKKIGKQYYKATHHTFAYVIGKNGQLKRFSDDGEPSGTAGKPILKCILQNNLTNILIIVTRYFGGIKLGAGGLVRAYSSAASLGITTAKIIKMQYSTLVKICCEYTLLGKLESYFKSKNILIKDIQYQDKVTIFIYLPQSIVNCILQEITNITNDQACSFCLDQEYIAIIL
ncbi:MAG: YigZ family protein [Eubacteriales bacterium]